MINCWAALFFLSFIFIMPSLNLLAQTATQSSLLTPDPAQRDSDADGLPDAVEQRLGTDIWLTDTDGDGLSDDREVGSNPEQPQDTDNDRKIDALDIDDDNDGIPTVIEAKQDSDGDGLADYLDEDSDADGVSDRLEAGVSGQDADNDGLDNDFDVDHTGGQDDNGDGIDGHHLIADTDGDGLPNLLDADDDNDGRFSVDEVYQAGSKPQDTDTDQDGIPDYLDSDDDGDGAPSQSEDMNHNGLLEDDDSDQDGIPDYLDANDYDGPVAGQRGSERAVLRSLRYQRQLNADRAPASGKVNDSDGDGIEDALEIGLDEAFPVDTDEDGTADYLDSDDDNDGVPSLLEGEGDRDGDGRVNYLDVDAGGYFYCAGDGRIVAGVSDFKVTPTEHVRLTGDGRNGRFNWRALQAGTYALTFTLPPGMRVMAARKGDTLSLEGMGASVLSLGRSEDIARPGYLGGFVADDLPLWYERFALGRQIPWLINLNIPLIGGACDSKRRIERK